jgi:hypothetical protein
MVILERFLYACSPPLVRFGIASVAPGNYVAVAPHVGGSNASYIKLVLQREPRTGKAAFHAGNVFPNEEYVDAATRKLFEEISFIYPHCQRFDNVEWC